MGAAGQYSGGGVTAGHSDTRSCPSPGSALLAGQAGCQVMDKIEHRIKQLLV
jgi:hypothetical protein